MAETGEAGMSKPVTTVGTENATKPQCLVFQDTKALDASLAEYVAQRLNECVAERGKASLVVSGGSTPLGFFRCLAAIPLPWSSIQITLADERWVPVDDPDSNEGLLRRMLPALALTSLLSLRGEADTPEQQVVDLNRQFHGSTPFDLVILGMGNDAHTASLFPDAPQLSAGLNPTTTDACLLVDPPVAPHQRISMTLARLLNAEQIVVHITGKEKAEVLQRAWAANAPQRYPIGAILRQQGTPVSVFSDRLVRLEP